MEWISLYKLIVCLPQTAAVTSYDSVCSSTFKAATVIDTVKPEIFACRLFHEFRNLKQIR